MFHICQDEILAALNILPNVQVAFHQGVHWWNVHILKKEVECEHAHECCEEDKDAN